MLIKLICNSCYKTIRKDLHLLHLQNAQQLFINNKPKKLEPNPDF